MKTDFNKLCLLWNSMLRDNLEYKFYSSIIILHSILHTVIPEIDVTSVYSYIMQEGFFTDPLNISSIICMRNTVEADRFMQDYFTKNNLIDRTAINYLFSFFDCDRVEVPLPALRYNFKNLENISKGCLLLYEYCTKSTKDSVISSICGMLCINYYLNLNNIPFITFNSELFTKIHSIAFKDYIMKQAIHVPETIKQYCDIFTCEAAYLV